MNKLEDGAQACKAMVVGQSVKFASQLDRELLRALREHAETSGRSISAVLDDAVREYLDRADVRPAFRSAMEEVLQDHDELLQRLAR